MTSADMSHIVNEVQTQNGVKHVELHLGMKRLEMKLQRLVGIEHLDVCIFKHILTHIFKVLCDKCVQIQASQMQIAHKYAIKVHEMASCIFADKSITTMQRVEVGIETIFNKK
jgi:hypothetical protein